MRIQLLLEDEVDKLVCNSQKDISKQTNIHRGIIFQTYMFELKKLDDRFKYNNGGLPPNSTEYAGIKYDTNAIVERYYRKYIKGV